MLLPGDEEGERLHEHQQADTERVVVPLLEATNGPDGWTASGLLQRLFGIFRRT